MSSRLAPISMMLWP